MARVADDAGVPAARSADIAETEPVPAGPDGVVLGVVAVPTDSVPPDPFTEVQSEERTAQRKLTSIPEAARHSRRFLKAVLGEAGVPATSIQDAQTVVSEFVIEALARGRPPRSLDVNISRDQFRIELAAEGKCDPIDADASRQLSIDLIARITTSSGSRPITDGRVWWAVLPLRSVVLLPPAGHDQPRPVER